MIRPQGSTVQKPWLYVVVRQTAQMKERGRVRRRLYRQAAIVIDALIRARRVPILAEPSQIPSVMYKYCIKFLRATYSHDEHH